MDKYARYSNQEVIWTNHGPYTGKSKPVNHGSGWGCLFTVLLIVTIGMIEIAGPDAFMRLMHEISALLLY